MGMPKKNMKYVPLFLSYHYVLTHGKTQKIHIWRFVLENYWVWQLDSKVQISMTHLKDLLVTSLSFALFELFHCRFASYKLVDCYHYYKKDFLGQSKMAHRGVHEIHPLLLIVCISGDGYFYWRSDLHLTISENRFTGGGDLKQ